MSHKYFIKNLIDDRKIKAMFQPILSIKRKVIVGFEALSRGIDLHNKIILPEKLFKIAESEGLISQLDSLCHNMAVKKFYSNFDSHKDTLLFLNFDISEADNGPVGISNAILELTSLLKLITAFNLSPQNIVIEIIESKVQNIDFLKNLINIYKNYGFLIALDDVGSGHSNLNRISIIKPDILKIDKYIVSDIHKSYYKQEVFKSMSNLARQIGALTIAKGIESKEEALCALELGADMLQGFYFAKPSDTFDLDIKKRILLLGTLFKESLNSRFYYKLEQNSFYLALTKKIATSLEGSSNFNTYALQCMLDNPFIDCIYIIDTFGIQIADTILNPKKKKINKNFLFSPALKNYDHSLKQYFYHLSSSDNNEYISDPYISLATGTLCSTISNRLNNKNILCIDIDIKHLENNYLNKLKSFH